MITTEIKNQLYRLILHSEAQKYTIAKLEGKEVKYPHQKNYLTEAELEQSIKGLRSLGIMLIQDKTSLVKAGCLDIDCPRDAEDLTQGLALAQRLQKIALKSNLRAYLEYSGNRGYHFWIFAEKAITGSLMQSVLKTIANQANFEVLEIFPNKVPVESKCIKLPTTTHLKSGKRCGFIDSDFNPLTPEINLEKQAKIMAGFIQNSVFDLTAVANTSDSEIDNFTNGNNSSQNFSTKSNVSNQEKINQKLNSFGNSHPSCINHLLNNGCPPEIDFNQSNLTLARYCISRSYHKEKAYALAELMAKNTPDSHPTSKDYQGKISNFKSAFNSASRNSDDYQFNCSYVLSNLNGQKLADRGCIGSQCSLFIPKSDHEYQNNFNSTNQNNSKEAQKYPLNRFIFEAIGKLANEDKELCKSLILFETEKLIKNTEPINSPDNVSNSIKLIEAELLSYLIKSPDLLSDWLEIFPQGFTSTTSQPLSQYLDYLFNLELPSEDTLENHLNYIRESGVKQVASSKLIKYQTQLKSPESAPVEVISEVIDESEKLLKQSLNDKQLLPVVDRIGDWLAGLLNEEKISIPTFCQDLNYLLNGGLSQGRLYVLGSPPANGKSTISAQIGDLASSQGFKVVYASYEMSAEQIFLTSLSRLGLINSSLLEGKRFIQDENLKLKLLAITKQYKEKIAENIHIIEADDLYTPNRLLAVVKKFKADLLIVDYLQLLSSGDAQLDSAYQETIRVSKIATELKRISRKANIPIIAISDVNKTAYDKAIKGGDLDMSALRDSFKIAHSADVIMLLMSNNIEMNIKEYDSNNKSAKSVTQLHLLAEKFRDNNLKMSQQIGMLAHEYKLDKARADTYSRLIIAKNRTGRCGEVLFRYSKALHYFEPMTYLTHSININQEGF